MAHTLPKNEYVVGWGYKEYQTWIEDGWPIQSNVYQLMMDSRDIKNVSELIVNLAAGLNIFTVMNCGLVAIPNSITMCKKLMILNLKENKISSLPDDVGDFSQLTLLDCSFNNFTEFPKQLCKCISLYEIRFNNNKIVKLPKEIGQFTNIWTLDFSNNQLKKIPDEICNLKNVKQLNFCNNQLTELPLSIGTMTPLVILSVARNNIYEIQDGFFDNLKLGSLDISFNQLTKLPQIINTGCLTNFKVNDNPVTGFTRTSTESPESPKSQKVVRHCIIL
jgi:Leucine-rich repeat (LRR) protein